MIRITKDGAERLLLKLDVEEETHGRMSAWSKGVYDYARWMIRPILDNEVEDGREFESMKDYCLNGAQGFKELSYNGNYYIYDEDIANQLATRSERRYSKVDGRLLPPNSRESWLDVQGRALYQAWRKLARLSRGLFEEEQEVI